MWTAPQHLGLPQRHPHALNTSTGEQCDLGSNQGDLGGSKKEQGQQMSAHIKAAFRPELPATSLLLFVFACHTDRRGKGKRIFGFIQLPRLMWLQF